MMMANKPIDTPRMAEHYVPVPDPTVLTTEALTREIEHLKELFNQRVTAMDKAMDLFNENITRVPTDTDKQIHHLERLMHSQFSVVDEKFRSVYTQFSDRDSRVEQTARDTKVAVDAALQAAEKAVSKQNESFSLSIAKSETATIKQIDQQGIIISTSTAALNDKIEDMKARLTLIEGQAVGQRTGSNTTTNWIGVIVGIALVVIAFTGLIISHWIAK
jgi:hypothetical protein